MRSILKLVLAAGLAGSGFTGYLLWRELFVLHGPWIGTPTFVYGGFVFIVLAAIVGLRATRPQHFLV